MPPRYWISKVSIGIVIAFSLIIIGTLLYFLGTKIDFLPKIGLIVFGFGFSFIITSIIDLLSGGGIKGAYILLDSETCNLINDTKIIGGEFDPKHNGDLINKALSTCLKNPDAIFYLMGTTLGSLFGDRGMFNDFTNLLSQRNNNEKIRVLILNPFSFQAIIKAVIESHHFDPDADPLSRLIDYNLINHTNSKLVDDFRIVSRILLNDIRIKDIIECKVYDFAPISFMIIGSNFALTEQLSFGQLSGSNDLLCGKLPILKYGPGESMEVLKNHFDFVWNNTSLPLSDYNFVVEKKQYDYNRFLILQNLQGKYWEKQWAGGKLPYNKEKDLYTDLAKKWINVNSPKRVLDLGCGVGGGGSYELATDILKIHDSTLEVVDISSTAIKEFKNKLNNNMISNRVKFVVKDMLSFLCSMYEDELYDCIYSNVSVIYLTKAKSCEAFKHIYRLLKLNGTFFGSFFTKNYFKITEGNGEYAKQGFRPSSKWIKVPTSEDIRIMASGKRKGEIRRFYFDEGELKYELKEAGFKEDNIFSELVGDKKQVINIRARK